jgi:hypothetical protein
MMAVKGGADKPGRGGSGKGVWCEHGNRSQQRGIKKGKTS